MRLGVKLERRLGMRQRVLVKFSFTYSFLGGEKTDGKFKPFGFPKFYCHMLPDHMKKRMKS